MTFPALSTPHPTPSLEQARAAFWSLRTASREQEADALWSACLRWQLSNPGGFPSQFLAYMCEGREESTGTLYSTLDRGRARASGYSGNLTHLALLGRALRTGLTRAEIDALSPEELQARLRQQTLSDVESRAAALAPAQERTRALLREADPDAPTSATEADALNLSVLEVLPAPLYRAAVQAAQTGDVSALADLAEAVKPPRYIEWGKRHGACWVCQQSPSTVPHDAHHVAYGGHEARRNDGGPEKFAFVHRACHVPQPFSPAVTAHSRAFSVGRDPDRLTAFIEYDAIQHARYEAWIRGEA